MPESLQGSTQQPGARGSYQNITNMDWMLYEANSKRGKISFLPQNREKVLTDIVKHQVHANRTIGDVMIGTVGVG